MSIIPYPARLRKDRSTRLSVLHSSILVTLVTFATVHVRLDRPIDDPFQEAEYTIYRAPLAPTPLGLKPVLIHGGMDLLPTRLATEICAPDRQIACVRTINMGLQMSAELLLLGTVALLFGLGTWSSLVAGLPSVGVLLVLAAEARAPIDSQQGAPSLRDLPVLATLALLALVARAMDRGTRLKPWRLVALGAIAAASPFWVYNRGILLIVVVACAGAGMSLAVRSTKPLLMILAGGIGALVIALMTGGADVFISTFEDILYWQENEELWRLPLHTYFLRQIAVLYTCALVITVPVLGQLWRNGRKGTVLMAGILALTGGLYLAQSLNRSDAGHLRMALWPATLLIGIGIAQLLAARHKRFTRIVATRGGIATVIILYVYLAYAFTDRTSLWDIPSALASNIRLLNDGLPTDRSIAGGDLSRAADIVRRSAQCTFAANNAGILHLLSGMPPCSRFAFGAYIAPSRQAEVIATLAATRPAVILWDAPHPWAHIDGRDLAARVPTLSEWIVRNYPVQTPVGEHILRSKAPLPME